MNHKENFGYDFWQSLKQCSWIGLSDWISNLPFTIFLYSQYDPLDTDIFLAIIPCVSIHFTHCLFGT